MPYPILDESFKNITEAEYNQVKEELVKHKPKTDKARLNRVIFAHLSVQQTCKANTKSFRYIKENADDNSFKDLQSSLVMVNNCCAGLNNMRAKGLWLSHKIHKEDSSFLSKRDGESWKECRSRLNGQLFGINLAKISFALELMYPSEAKVVCLDKHLLTQFGHPAGRPIKQQEYYDYETYFLDLCSKYNYLPAVAREVIWRKSVLNKKTKDSYANTWLTTSFGDEVDEQDATSNTPVQISSS